MPVSSLFPHFVYCDFRRTLLRSKRPSYITKRSPKKCSLV